MSIGLKEFGTEWVMTNKKVEEKSSTFLIYLVAANTLSFGHFVVNIL